MTKLKNTKKGMAKKALSISLVAAMLATSNVPVWAADFSDGSDAASAVSVDEPVFDAGEEVVEPAAVAADAEETEDPVLAGVVTAQDLDFSGLNISADDEGKISVTGSIKKTTDGTNLLQFAWKLVNTDTNSTIASGEVLNGNININTVTTKTGNVAFIITRNDQNAVFNVTAATVTVKPFWTDFAPNNASKKVSFKWTYDGKDVESGGIAYDKSDLDLTVTLPRALTDGETATLNVYGKDANGQQTILTGNLSITKATIEKGETTLHASYQLSKTDIGQGIYAVVTIAKAGKANYIHESSVIRVTKEHAVLSGKPSIKIAAGEAEVRPGVTLKADISGVTTTGSAADLHYRWQKYNPTTKKWEAVQPEATNPWYTDVNYMVQTTDYDHQIRVAVFDGDFYEESKAVFSDAVTVKAATLDEEAVVVDSKLTGNDGRYDSMMEDEVYWGEHAFNPTDFAMNRLDDSTDFVVRYRSNKLTPGTDYTVDYEGIDQIGNVTVTLTILPTMKTEYSSGTKVYKNAYKLVNNTVNYNFTITNAATSSEYNGKTVKPSVTIKNANGQTLDANSYNVYSVGPNTGTYTVNAYVNGQGMADNRKPGTTTPWQYTITAKNISNHTSDFELNIPDEVWEASEAAVEANSVNGAKITLIDKAVSETKDLLAKDSGESFTITALNWEEGGTKKQIKITFTDQYGGNYKGTITKEGTAVTRSITQFQAQFRNAIRTQAGSRTYNGKLQDVLGEILSNNTENIPGGNGTTGCITLKDAYNLNTYKLYVGRDFEYKIVKGGTNAGEVSIYIEGKGNYSGSMTLENVYTIGKANFRTDVKDNGTYFTLPYDPSLGDKGGKVDVYTEKAKGLLALNMVDGNYKLTEGKDYWLDVVSNVTAIDEIWFRPTVRANKGEGHGENTNFLTDDRSYADRDYVTVKLVHKNLSASDIKVTVTRSEYNGGKLVIPEVKVAYVKDGKEYVISSDYYDVKIIKSAYDKGQTGKVNIIAKTGLDRSKYPQLYTGNQMVDYTVGATNLALGSIVAENGLATLPSVAYDAAQANSEKGITLAEGKFLVKDASGNVVDPKYYTVSYTNNKAVGTATITVTGKGEYEGSVSANFNIVKNNLPSGNITLMENMLDKTYTGEGVQLIAGTDYTITGELAKLTEGTDYMISYENNVNVTTDTSKASIKLVGINNYAGEVVANFNIKPATISAADITVGTAVYQGGADVQPAVTITIPGGKTTLTEGTDYTVTYNGHAINAGDKGSVTIAYKENKNINTADSAKTAEYTVAAKDLKDVTIQAIADQEATGSQIRPEITVLNGSVKMESGKDYQVSYGDNTEVGVGTVTVKPAEGNSNYTGSQEVSFKIVEPVPEVGRAMISNVTVKGNVATAILSDTVDGAEGYDFVIATEEDYKNGRVDISKNILKTKTNFYYVQEGTYYAYCHAWKRGEDGKKVFGDWSNLFKFEVGATTPSTPVIKSVKVSGSTVTVTYSKCADATGYDVVLGTSIKKVNGEMRPVNYGTLVTKVTKGDTVTAVFKNVPKKTYYAGLHAYNRTSEDGKKVFSKWSESKEVTVK